MENKMQNIELVSFCGLYCGNCGKYKNGKCLGCAKNKKATWCKIRTCNIEQGIKSCADCKIISLNKCKKFNNPVAKVFSYLFNSNRASAIAFIKGKGYLAFVNQMNETGKMTMPRK